ncbi:MAG: GntR family transcriptional regulator [Clostridia bacterium]
MAKDNQVREEIHYERIGYFTYLGVSASAGCGVSCAAGSNYNGELKPGDRLMETSLAERMGVSRTPVREAIRKLELEGFVVMLPRKGAQVAQITRKDIGDVLEIRAVLEGLGVELAAKKMQAEDIEELKRINGEFASAIPTGDVAKLVELDTRFHDFIFTKADNERLQQIIGSLVEQVSRFRVTYLRKPTYHDAIAKEHEAIIRAIEGRDLEERGGVRWSISAISREKLSAVEE